MIVSEPREASAVSGEDAQKIIDAYHQEQLRTLLEQVRRGLARLDAGEIDEFELDYLIHRYKASGETTLDVLWILQPSRARPQPHWRTCGSGARTRLAGRNCPSLGRPLTPVSILQPPR